VRRPHGYAVWSDPDGVVERDTFTCNHCNRVCFVRPLADASEQHGFCLRCMRNICGPCADVGRCAPFEKLIEEAEQRERFARAAGLAAR
jgi:hypothetical protein